MFRSRFLLVLCLSLTATQLFARDWSISFNVKSWYTNAIGDNASDEALNRGDFTVDREFSSSYGGSIIYKNKYYLSVSRWFETEYEGEIANPIFIAGPQNAVFHREDTDTTLGTLFENGFGAFCGYRDINLDFSTAGESGFFEITTEAEGGFFGFSYGRLLGEHFGMNASVGYAWFEANFGLPRVELQSVQGPIGPLSFSAKPYPISGLSYDLVLSYVIADAFQVSVGYKSQDFESRTPELLVLNDDIELVSPFTGQIQFITNLDLQSFSASHLAADGPYIGLQYTF